MLLREDRNCSCNNSNYNMSNNEGCNDDETMLTQTTCVSTECGYEKSTCVNCEARREMIQKIRCYDFAITELALYLDTHPEDEKALCLHRKYCKEVKELKDKYQKVYGPLTINYPCNKWRWIEEPWPWERGNY